MAEDTVAAGLTVSYVTGLAEVVPAVISYLNDRAGRDLFEIESSFPFTHDLGALVAFDFDCSLRCVDR